MRGDSLIKIRKINVHTILNNELMLVQFSDLLIKFS